MGNRFLHSKMPFSLTKTLGTRLLSHGNRFPRLTVAENTSFDSSMFSNLFHSISIRIQTSKTLIFIQQTPTLYYMAQFIYSQTFHNITTVSNSYNSTHLGIILQNLNYPIFKIPNILIIQLHPKTHKA